MPRPRNEFETGHFADDAQDRRSAISGRARELLDGLRFVLDPGLHESIEKIWIQYLVRAEGLVVAKPFKDVHKPFLDLDRNLKKVRAQITRTAALRPKAQGDLHIRAALHAVLSDAGLSLSAYDKMIEATFEAIAATSIAIGDLKAEVEGIVNVLEGAESTFQSAEQLRDEARLAIRDAMLAAGTPAGHGVKEAWNNVLMHLEDRVRTDDAEADLTARENLRDELTRLLKKTSRGDMPEGES